MRVKFEQQLNKLHHELIEMGSYCESAIAMSAEILTKSDKKSVDGVLSVTSEIDQKEREIEGMCLKLLLQQQPVARDLRTISSALKMVTDLERIGDNSGDIAEIAASADFSALLKTLDISGMAKATIKMVTDSVDAFVKRDINLARSVVKYDDVVDEYFISIRGSLIDEIKNHNADGESEVDLLMIAKYFERIGDHAVNIAKWVIFSVTGTKEA